MGCNFPRMLQNFKCQSNQGNGKSVLTLWRCLADIPPHIPIFSSVRSKENKEPDCQPVVEGFQKMLSNQSSPLSVSCLQQALKAPVSSWPRNFYPGCSEIIYSILGIYLSFASLETIPFSWNTPGWS